MPARLLSADPAVFGHESRLIALNHNKHSTRTWTGEKGTLWFCDLRQPTPKLALPPLPAHFEECALSSTTALDAAMTSVEGRDARHLAGQRLARGTRCFVAWLDDSIVSYAWVSAELEWIGEFEHYLRLSPGESYIWNCMTLLPYRGCGLYKALLRLATSTLAAEGSQRAWIVTQKSNIPANRGVATLGFQPILDLDYCRAGPLSCLHLTAREGTPEELHTAQRALCSKGGEICWQGFAWRWRAPERPIKQ